MVVVALAAAHDKVSTFSDDDGPLAPAQAPGAVSAVNHSPAVFTLSIDAVDEPELSTNVKLAPPTAVLPNVTRPEGASAGFVALQMPHVPSLGVASAELEPTAARLQTPARNSVPTSSFLRMSDPSCWADK
jgi:hypothetical protein